MNQTFLRTQFPTKLNNPYRTYPSHAFLHFFYCLLFSTSNLQKAIIILDQTPRKQKHPAQTRFFTVLFREQFFGFQKWHGQDFFTLKTSSNPWNHKNIWKAIPMPSLKILLFFLHFPNPISSLTEVPSASIFCSVHSKLSIARFSVGKF